MYKINCTDVLDADAESSFLKNQVHKDIQVREGERRDVLVKLRVSSFFAHLNVNVDILL